MNVQSSSKPDLISDGPSGRLPSRAGNNRFESIQQSESNRIAGVEFDLSGRLQSRCQQYVPVGSKMATNGDVL